MFVVAIESQLLVVTTVRVDKVYLEAAAMLAAVDNPVPFRRPAWAHIIAVAGCYSFRIATVKIHDKYLGFAETVRDKGDKSAVR